MSTAEGLGEQQPGPLAAQGCSLAGLHGGIEDGDVAEVSEKKERRHCERTLLKKSDAREHEPTREAMKRRVLSDAAV